VSPTNHVLDGIAVVSDIVASSVPRVAAAKLKSILHAFTNSFTNPSPLRSSNSAPPDKSIIEGVINLMNTIRRLNPLVHQVCYPLVRLFVNHAYLVQITNNVVATQSANVTLALGASPIMATEPREMEDLSHICSALLVNIGTMRSDSKGGMLNAGKLSNKCGKVSCGSLSISICPGYFGNTNKKPVVFDPVGIGASTFRKETVNGKFTLDSSEVFYP
jgi:thiamine-phosphate diphosphorylase/hydroxyethylthiazole kinase